MKKEMIVIAGPCSIENEQMIIEIYEQIKDDITIFRGGAFKPRTKVESFQGLHAKGIELITAVSQKPIASEIMDTRDIDLFKNIEYVQIGARNMQNFALLKEVGKNFKKVILKRGLSSTVEEFVAAAEYLKYYGCEQVILCERGIRTFSDSSRFTLDFSAVIKLRQETDYQVIIDVSHAAGDVRFIDDLARAAIACGADGIMIEVHNNPLHALSDANQQITPNHFQQLIAELEQIHQLITKQKS